MSPFATNRLTSSAQKTGKTFLSTTPLLIAVLLLAGLLSAQTIPDKIVQRLAGQDILGPLLSAFVGSIAVGHPITSYVLAGELLAKGIGLISVTALIVAWVTVGVVQLPIEAIHFGQRFAILRNLIAFSSALAVAYLTVITTEGFTAWLATNP